MSLSATKPVLDAVRHWWVGADDGAGLFRVDVLTQAASVRLIGKTLIKNIVDEVRYSIMIILWSLVFEEY